MLMKKSLKNLAKKMDIELGEEKLIEGISFAFGLTEEEKRKFILEYRNDEEWIEAMVEDEAKKGYYGLFGADFESYENSYMEVNEIEDWDDLTEKDREHIWNDIVEDLTDWCMDMEDDTFISWFGKDILKYKSWRDIASRFILKPTEAYFDLDDATYVNFNVLNEKEEVVSSGVVEWGDYGVWCSFSDELVDYFMPESDSMFFGNEVIKFEELREVNKEFDKFIKGFDNLYEKMEEIDLREYHDNYYDQKAKGEAFLEALKKADLEDFARKMTSGRYYDDSACASVGGKPTEITYVKGETDIKVAKDILHKWILNSISVGYNTSIEDGEIYHAAGYSHDDFSYDNIQVFLEA